MADSSSNLTQISSSQFGKEATANALFDAGSPGTVLGRNAAATSGLTWAVFGGKVLLAGTPTQIANATVTLTANATNFVEFDPNNTGSNSGVSVNQSGFTAGRLRLYTVAVDNTSQITSYTDHRMWGAPVQPRLSVAVGGGVNVTLNDTQIRADVIEFTGTLTANIAVICPNNMPLKVFRNLTTGAFTLTIRTSGGTGPAPAQNRSILAYANGTDVIRVTPDQATP